jgi:hypothetical protein
MLARTPMPIAFAVLALVPSSALSAPAPSKRLYATLSGDAEVPGPGKKNASGSATIKLFAPQRLCYSIRYAKIPDATVAHIHEGARGKSGPPIVTLNKPDQQFEGCTKVSHALFYQLANSPRQFYVNVHSANFPAGAIRGQLHH